MRALLGWFLKLVSVKQMIPTSKLVSFLGNIVSHLYSPDMWCNKIKFMKFLRNIKLYIFTVSVISELFHLVSSPSPNWIRLYKMLSFVGHADSIPLLNDRQETKYTKIRNTRINFKIIVFFLLRQYVLMLDEDYAMR